MDFVRAVRAAAVEVELAEVTDGDGKFGFAGEFLEELVASEVDHVILGVGGEAEREAGFFEKEGGVSGAIGEVDVEVAHSLAGEDGGQPGGIAGAGGGFE